MVAAWHDVLTAAGVMPRRLHEAARRWACKSRWWPSVADVVEMARACAFDAPPTVDAAQSLPETERSPAEIAKSRAEISAVWDRVRAEVRNRYPWLNTILLNPEQVEQNGGTRLSKPCAKCGEDKPIRHFYRDKTRSDGRGAYCRECHKLARIKCEMADRPR